MKKVLFFCFVLLTGCVGVLPTVPVVSMRSSSYTPPTMDVATPPIPRPELSASFSKARHVMVYGSIDNPWGELTLVPKQDGPISKITVNSYSSCYGSNFVVQSDASKFIATQELPLSTPIKGMKGQPVTLSVKVDAPGKDQCGGTGATSFRLENIEATVNGIKTPATLTGDTAVELVEASNVAHVTLEKAATTPLTTKLYNGEQIQPVKIKLTADIQEDVYVIDVNYWNFTGLENTMLIDRNGASAGMGDLKDPLHFTNIRYTIPRGSSRELTLDGKATSMVRQGSFDVTVTYQGATSGVRRRVTKTFYW